MLNRPPGQVECVSGAPREKHWSGKGRGPRAEQGGGASSGRGLRGGRFREEAWVQQPGETETLRRMEGPRHFRTRKKTTRDHEKSFPLMMHRKDG